MQSGFLSVQERDASNSITREYTWGLDKGGGIGGLLNLKEGTADYSFIYDGKGNVMAVLDSSQAVVASYRYDEFGNRLKKTGALDQPFQFSTKRYDEQTGLSYYGYRFYSPTIGRWLNRDPLGEAGGINLYGFVGNSPVNYYDPWGLDYLTYSNNKLTWVTEKRPKILGIPMPWKVETGRKSWNAWSGTAETGSSAIPEGSYSTSPSDKEYHAGEERAWGSFSYRLHESLLTRALNRLRGRSGGFHIHGGYDRGTAGCIEFRDYAQEQSLIKEFDKLLQNCGKEITLYVD